MARSSTSRTGRGAKAESKTPPAAIPLQSGEPAHPPRPRPWLLAVAAVLMTVWLGFLAWMAYF